MRASATGQLSQEELLSARQTMTEEQYSSEFECDPFAAILGAYYGKDIAACEAEGRITDLPPEPGVPVHTAWDLGHRHSTAIWFFQVVGPEVRIIDFYENHGQYADHYCGVVSARGYLQGKDFVPHAKLSRMSLTPVANRLA
jgi:phage terminase large subunit